jgi:hypothetical protein
MNNDGCNILGIPTNNTEEVTSYTSKKANRQTFSKAGKITDLYISEFGNISISETSKSLYDNKGGFGTLGLVKKIYKDKNRGQCVETEKELLCEREAPPGPVCEDSQVVVGDICRDKKEVECESKGMTKYVNPNNAGDVTCAKINKPIYVNQYLNTNGATGDPQAGRNMCGAHAVLMALSIKGIVTEKDYTELKKYTYENRDATKSSSTIMCDWVNDYIGANYGPSQQNMYNVGGIWQYIGDSSYKVYSSHHRKEVNACTMTNWWSMYMYLKTFGQFKHLYYDTLEWKSLDAVAGNPKDYYNKVKTMVDEGGGILHSIYDMRPTTFQHIFLISGYTDDDLDGNPDRVIAYDSWKDPSDSKQDYSFSGNGAIMKWHADRTNFEYGSYIEFY